MTNEMTYFNCLIKLICQKSLKTISIKGIATIPLVKTKKEVEKPSKMGYLKRLSFNFCFNRIIKQKTKIILLNKSLI
jgi:hypothetical protein